MVQVLPQQDRLRHIRMISGGSFFDLSVLKVDRVVSRKHVDWVPIARGCCSSTESTARTVHDTAHWIPSWQSAKDSHRIDAETHLMRRARSFSAQLLQYYWDPKQVPQVSSVHLCIIMNQLYTYAHIQNRCAVWRTANRPSPLGIQNQRVHFHDS